MPESPEDFNTATQPPKGPTLGRSQAARICALPSEVVDQIAAGEVVERPAHLLKELLENSVDAGATEIEVEFAQGGRWISVRDNGWGIEQEQMSLAVSRHATSKIRLSSDLWNLSTFGFRGEALASIAAVSRLTLTSRTDASETAWKLQAEFGKIGPVAPSGGLVGTHILVEDLFANVPARLKFLKSDAAESSQIRLALKALALAHPQISLRVRSQGKLLAFHPPVRSRLERAEQVLEIRPMYLGEAERGPVKVQAAFTSPKQTVGSSRQIWLFAQDRWVQDRALQAAVMEAYRNLLMHGQYPAVVVWLECSPDWIDVNIHPSKSQVKFQDASIAFRAVQAALRESLQQAPWLQGLASQPQSQPQFQSQSQFHGLSSPDSDGPNGQFKQNPNFQPGFDGDEFSRTQYSRKAFPLSGVHDSLKTYAPAHRSSSRQPDEMASGAASSENGASVAARPPSAPSLDASAIEAPTTEAPTTGASTTGASTTEGSAPGLFLWGQLQVLGQAHLTYIMAQHSRSLFLVDQHAAHERIVFEKLMTAWQGGRIEIQDYLLPLTLAVEAEVAEALMAEAEELQKLGVHIDQTGPEHIAVRSAPALISEKGLQHALQKLGRECVDKGGSFAVEKVVADLCASMACHSVVRAGQSLSNEQMHSLLAQMDEFPLSSFCPHGRPVYIEYPFNKIEREFGRIV